MLPYSVIAVSRTSHFICRARCGRVQHHLAERGPLSSERGQPVGSSAGEWDVQPRICCAGPTKGGVLTLHCTFDLIGETF
jgi:hypothetical protein